MLVRGKTRNRIAYLRPDTAKRMKEYVALCGQVSPDKSGTPLFTTIGFHSGDARLSRRTIRVHTDKYLRAAGLKRLAGQHDRREALLHYPVEDFDGVDGGQVAIYRGVPTKRRRT